MTVYLIERSLRTSISDAVYGAARASGMVEAQEGPILLYSAP
jgi:hypothetical protein